MKREDLHTDNTQGLKLLENKGNVDAGRKSKEPNLYTSPYLNTTSQRDDIGAEDKRNELYGPTSDLYSALT